jgi:CheY-like chemotaxis protein
MRVLFVDDDPVMRKLGEYALENLGEMSLLTASDGVEALARVSEFVPDAILLDYMMPDMNGDEVLAVLKSNSGTRHIPVVFLTGADDENLLTQFIEDGAAGYILKPFDPLTLAEDLTSVLRGVPGCELSPS